MQGGYNRRMSETQYLAGALLAGMIGAAAYGSIAALSGTTGRPVATTAAQGFVVALELWRRTAATSAR